MEFRVGKAGLLFVFFEGAKELHLPSLRNFLFVDLPRLYSPMHNLSLWRLGIRFLIYTRILYDHGWWRMDVFRRNLADFEL
jgi:hypothetical protein